MRSEEKCENCDIGSEPTPGVQRCRDCFRACAYVSFKPLNDKGEKVGGKKESILSDEPQDWRTTKEVEKP